MAPLLVIIHPGGADMTRDRCRCCAPRDDTPSSSSHAHFLNRRVMVAKRSRFYCDLCNKGYEFRSKYDRQLVSSTHLNLEDAMILQRNIEYNECVLPASTFTSRPNVSVSSYCQMLLKLLLSTPSTGSRRT